MAIRIIPLFFSLFNFQTPPRAPAARNNSPSPRGTKETGRQVLESGESTCEQRVAVCRNHAQRWVLRTTLQATDHLDT